MRKFFGIAVFALALSAAAGCGGPRYHRYGPPPPPPPPYGAMMGHPNAGFVWIPGHNRWVGKRHRWVEGRWVRPPRPGMIWVPGYRAPRRGGHVWIEGHWR